MAALHLGAGRRTKQDEIDHSVGVVCHAKRGASVEQGALLAEVHARDEASGAEAVEAVLAAYELGDEAPTGALDLARRRCLSYRRSKPYGSIAPALEGRRLEHVEISDIRLTRPEDP